MTGTPCRQVVTDLGLVVDGDTAHHAVAGLPPEAGPKSPEQVAAELAELEAEIYRDFPD